MLQGWTEQQRNLFGGQSWDLKLNKALCTCHHLGKMDGFAHEVLNVFLEQCKSEIDCFISKKKFLISFTLLRERIKQL